MDGPSRPRGLLPVQGPLPVQGALKVWLWRCSNPTLPPGQWQRQGAGTPRPQQAVSVEAETMPVTGGEHGLEDAPGGKGPRKLLPLAAVGREHQLFPGCTGAQAMGLATPPHPCSSLGALTRWGRGLGLALGWVRRSPKESCLLPSPGPVSLHDAPRPPLRCSCLIDIATPPPPCPWPSSSPSHRILLPRAPPCQPTRHLWGSSLSQAVQGQRVCASDAPRAASGPGGGHAGLPPSTQL